MIYRVYSDLEGIPEIIQCGIFFCPDTYTLVSDPADADILAYPTHYQVAYEYGPDDFAQHGLTADLLPLIHQKFKNLDDMCRLTGKPLVVIYLRDSPDPLPLSNAVIFRSSLRASNRQQNEFAYPPDVGKRLYRASHGRLPLPWTLKPSVGFRGQLWPMKKGSTLEWRYDIQRSFQKMGLRSPWPIKSNFGYLARARAFNTLDYDKRVDFDGTASTLNDVINIPSRYAYVKNILGNQYNLVASGHGNYSFRFYEVMSAARIPLFINTDCVLPLEELIPFKSMLAWVEEKEVHKVVDKLLDFHQAQNDNSLAAKQQALRATWETYFADHNYFRHIPFYLRHFI